jgi:hypothetical protein
MMIEVELGVGKGTPILVKGMTTTIGLTSLIFISILQRVSTSLLKDVAKGSDGHSFSYDIVLLKILQ